MIDISELIHQATLALLTTVDSLYSRLQFRINKV